MVVLTEQIEIPASYEKFKAWTANFEEEFVKWSPYHIECNLYNGNYHAGSKVRFREIVMGLDYDVTGTITECEQDENHFRIVFRSDKKTAFITFEGKRTETGCHFSHTEAFGMTTPVIGAFMNFLIFKVFFRKKANWQLIRDDMILDNRYLYDILTEGKYPERKTPVARRAKRYLVENFSVNVNAFDMVTGYRADDFYFDYAESFLNNGITVEQLARAMRLGKLGEQIVLKSRFAFSKLHYEGFEVADRETYFCLRKARNDEANRVYMEMLEEESDGLYIQDIMRGGIQNDDPRIPRNVSE